MLREPQSIFTFIGVGFLLSAILHTLLLGFLLCAILHTLFDVDAPLVSDQAEFVSEVKIIAAARLSHTLRVNESPWERETALMEKHGKIHMDTQDEANLAVRPNSNMRYGIYTTKTTDDDNVLISLIKGTCRLITGLAEKNNHNNVRFKDGLAETAGIRA